MAELSSEKPRSAAIVAAAYLEDVATLTLLTKMVPLSNNEHDSLFSGSAPLSPFSAKIQMLYAMGIIGKKIKHDLEAIKEIRNAFAHAKMSIDFDTPAIAAKLKGLHCLSLGGDAENLSSRQRFVSGAQILLIHLICKWGTYDPIVSPIVDFDPPHAVLGRPSPEETA
jgi:hypothetical protein